MSSESKETKTTSGSVGRQGRSKSLKDVSGRRGSNRSRSPSAYLRKKGKSMRGLFSTGDKKSKEVKSSSKSAQTNQTETTNPKDKREPSIAEKESASTTEAENITSSDDGKEVGEATTMPAQSNTTSKNNMMDMDETKPLDPDTPKSAAREEKKGEEPVSEDSADESTSLHEKTSTKSEYSPGREFAERGAKEAPETPTSAMSPDRENLVTVVSPYSPTNHSVAAVPSLDADETVQIILLLMDLQTRRFELLQLEFDPNLAVVNDILAQIPDAATEHVLRTQPYEGICSVDGSEMPTDVRLDTCVTKDNEVKIAIPSGITGKECAKLAFPILNDTKVRSMLGPDALPKDLRSLIGVDDPPKTTSKSKSSGDRIEKIISGEKIEEQTSRALAPADQSKGNIKSIMLVFLSSVAVVLFFNTYITMPLHRGTFLPAGGYLRKCGLWSLTLEDFNGCSEMLAEFDGSKMDVYRQGTLFGEKELVYSIVPETEKGGDGSSRLVLAEDGTISISGNKVLVVTDGTGKEQVNISLSPWPFADAVVLKKAKKKGKKILYKIH